MRPACRLALSCVSLVLVAIGRAGAVLCRVWCSKVACWGLLRPGVCWGLLGACWGGLLSWLALKLEEAGSCRVCGRDCWVQLPGQ